jgi:hypothetical protein
LKEQIGEKNEIFSVGRQLTNLWNILERILQRCATGREVDLGKTRWKNN